MPKLIQLGYFNKISQYSGIFKAQMASLHRNIYCAIETSRLPAFKYGNKEYRFKSAGNCGMSDAFFDLQSCILALAV